MLRCVELSYVVLCVIVWLNEKLCACACVFACLCECALVRLVEIEGTVADEAEGEIGSEVKVKVRMNTEWQ